MRPAVPNNRRQPYIYINDQETTIKSEGSRKQPERCRNLPRFSYKNAVISVPISKESWIMLFLSVVQSAPAY